MVFVLTTTYLKGGLTMKNRTVGSSKLRMALGLLAVIMMWQIFATLNKEREQLEELVSQIEKNLPMPAGAHQLAKYDRFYANGEGNDTDLVIGILRYSPTNQGRVHIVAYKSLPSIFDGGCNVIRIHYSRAKRQIERIECNGDA